MGEIEITHGWTTSEPDAGKDVDAPNLNDHQVLSIAIAGEDITSGTVADARIAATIARDAEVAAAVAAEAALARNADNLSSGTVADARIAATIARDSEVTSAVATEATARDAAITTHTGAADPHGDRAFATSADAVHAADTTAVHGIADTAALVLTADSRLSDARTPTAHKTSHEDGGADEISLTGLSGTPAALTTHEAAADPHPGYLTPAEGNAAYDAIGAAAAAQATAISTAAADVDAHEADTTNVHGITNTANLSLVGHSHTSTPGPGERLYLAANFR